MEMMDNNIQAIIHRPDGTYICIFFERKDTSRLILDSADILFGDIALDQMSKEEIIENGIHPLAYEIWNSLVRNKKFVRKPIVFNLFDNTVEFGDNRYFLLNDSNEILRLIESSSNLYY